MTTYAATSSRPVVDLWERSRVVPVWQAAAESTPVERHQMNRGGTPQPIAMPVPRAVREARREIERWRVLLGVVADERGLTVR